MLFKSVRFVLALKNEERLRKMYIQSTDERNSAIVKEASNAAIVIAILCFAVGGITASYFNKTVCVTLYLVTVTLGVIQFCTGIYFNKKM